MAVKGEVLEGPCLFLLSFLTEHPFKHSWGLLSLLSVLLSVLTLDLWLPFSAWALWSPHEPSGKLWESIALQQVQHLGGAWNLSAGGLSLLV